MTVTGRPAAFMKVGSYPRRVYFNEQGGFKFELNLSKTREEINPPASNNYCTCGMLSTDFHHYNFSFMDKVTKPNNKLQLFVSVDRYPICSKNCNLPEYNIGTVTLRCCWPRLYTLCCIQRVQLQGVYYLCKCSYRVFIISVNAAEQ